jgi:hypothetical protein
VVTDFRVMGANQLEKLARDLKANGDKNLRKIMLAKLRQAGSPLKVIAKQAALERLPKAGGLNEFVAASTFSLRTRTTGQNVGVKLTGRKRGHDIRSTDAGRLRHPVFARGGGAENVWVMQAIKPGWFTDSLDAQTVLAPMRKEMLAVLDEVTRRIARGG